MPPPEGADRGAPAGPAPGGRGLRGLAAPAAGEGGSASRLGRVAWAMRGPALLLAGPVAGVLMVANLFGIGGGLAWAAGGMLLLGVGLLGLLARAEWRRG